MSLAAVSKKHPAFLSGGGKLGALIREHDWESTSLGAPAGWPPALRAALSICLHSSFPTAIYWGPELRLLYNDAWAPIPAERHPWALGRPGSEVWYDIWDVVGPQFENVLATGEGFSTYDHLLPMIRNGSPTETYWNYSVTPIRGDHGAVMGIFNQGHETTASVVARREAKAELERLESMFSQAPGAVAVLRGPTHVFEIMNPAYAQLVGRGGLIGQSVEKALPEVVSQGFVALLDEVYASGRTHVGHAIPITLDRNNGQPEERFLDFVYQPLSDSAGQRSGIFVQVTDVTDATLSERALRASEAKFAAIANSIDQMIWSTLPDGHHDYYNDRWYEFTGVPYGTTDGEAWNGMFHADDQGRAWRLWKHSLRTGEPYHIQYRLRHHSGEYRWVIGRAQCVRNEHGDITRWFGTCMDIHDLKAAEEQLAEQTRSMRESEEFSRSVVESSPDCITVLNLDGTIQFMNENGRALTQADALAPLLGRPWSSLWPPSSKSLVEEAVAAALAGGVGRFSAFGPTATGVPKWWDVVVTPALGAGGEPLRLVSMSRDVTEQRQAEESRQLLLGELNHRVKNLFAIASGMVTMTSRSATSVPDMAQVLRGRLDALAKAHELIRSAIQTEAHDGGEGAELEALVREILRPHVDLSAVDQLTIEGPGFSLGVKATTSLALILHELATNAAKYGALCAPTGQLSVLWRLLGGGLSLDWIENGTDGTPKGIAREGFGSKLARATATGQLGGTIVYDWRPDGVKISITAPLERLQG
ncbi:MAG: PAS domain-containing protein [Beijerinckiaceae bacterium]|nr:PAS domain-containing protein [Beijerinckiaceae bacterium]